MAYYNIEKRLKSDGTPRYRCNVIIKEKGVITYRESKTFPKHAHAKTWGTQKVMELDLYGIPSSNAVDGLTVRDLLHKYLNDPNAGGKANFLCGPVCESEKYAGYDGKISTKNKNLY